MDRLDTWLSAQRGWRLLLVRWVALAPFGLGAGSLWTDLAARDPATPQVRVMVARMALCVAASFLLAALSLLPRPGRGRAFRRGSAARVPWLTWRWIAGMYCLFATLVVGAYEQAEPLAWRWKNRGEIWGILIPIFVLFAVFGLWNTRYTSRLRRLRDREASTADSPHGVL